MDQDERREELAAFDKISDEVDQAPSADARLSLILDWSRSHRGEHLMRDVALLLTRGIDYDFVDQLDRSTRLAVRAAFREEDTVDETVAVIRQHMTGVAHYDEALLVWAGMVLGDKHAPPNSLYAQIDHAEERLKRMGLEPPCDFSP